MSLTVVSGIICLLSMLWMVVHQPSNGDEKNLVLMIALAISFPLMIFGGINDMNESQAVESEVIQEVYSK